MYTSHEAKGRYAVPKNPADLMKMGCAWQPKEASQGEAATKAIRDILNSLIHSYADACHEASEWHGDEKTRKQIETKILERERAIRQVLDSVRTCFTGAVSAGTASRFQSQMAGYAPRLENILKVPCHSLKLSEKEIKKEEDDV